MARILAAVVLPLCAASLAGAWSSTTAGRQAFTRTRKPRGIAPSLSSWTAQQAQQEPPTPRTCRSRGAAAAAAARPPLQLALLAWIGGSGSSRGGGNKNNNNNNENGDEVDEAFLKAELGRYLDTRRELGADAIAKQEVGRQTGGTRGNALLEYVSLAPNKGSTVDSPPNVFDYSELQRYGYPHLATPIMKAGGRLAMYDLMGLERPPTSSALRLALNRAAAGPDEPIVIDRTGQNDSARYSGLKLGQVMDDNLQAQALAEAERKVRQGEALRPKLLEEQYERPFADLAKKSSSTSNPNPYWTAEKLDEWGKMRGKVIADARRADLDKIVPDRMESLDLDLPQRLYAISTGILISAAFGKSTPTFLTQFLNGSPSDLGALDALKAPAAALMLASIGSAVLCATQAPSKQRNPAVWLVKGLWGGPLSVSQFKDLPTLVTRRELEGEAQQGLDPSTR